jgi:hypothetical protein
MIIEKQLREAGYISSFYTDPQERPAGKKFTKDDIVIFMPNEEKEFFIDSEGVELNTIPNESNLIDLNCMYCNKLFKGEKPKMCCSGLDCGCMGMPIDPITCSDKCYDLFIKSDKKPKLLSRWLNPTQASLK